MEEMIREAFAPGNSVEILLRNYKVPTVGRFVGCSDGCLMLRTSRGNAIIVNVADIVRIALRPQYASENPAAEDSFIESFSPADSADNSDSVATGSENSPLKPPKATTWNPASREWQILLTMTFLNSPLKNRSSRLWAILIFLPYATQEKTCLSAGFPLSAKTENKFPLPPVCRDISVLFLFRRHQGKG